MIHYRNDVRGSGVDGRRLKMLARKLLVAAGESGSTLSLWLVDDAAIAELNRRHRDKRGPTDVLSFPLEPEAPSVSLLDDGSVPPERLLGDVVISVETARRQAAVYDADLDAELTRLLIHGLLHVLGHDHERP
ncbi:MAG: rRNA maturation RNase YbeY, partial [Bacillati bacterium]